MSPRARPLRDGALAIVLAMTVAGAMAISSACSSSAHPSRGTSDYYRHVSQRKQEILELHMQIRKWRVEDLGLRANPNRTEMAAVFRSSVGRLRICPKRPKPKTPKCTEVCTIKDAICDNAADICRIAGELGDDAWARDKCNSAKASCKESRERCCSCIAREPKQGAVDDLPAPF